MWSKIKALLRSYKERTPEELDEAISGATASHLNGTSSERLGVMGVFMAGFGFFTQLLLCTKTKKAHIRSLHHSISPLKTP